MTASLAFAGATVACACAALTGLSDYEISDEAGAAPGATSGVLSSSSGAASEGGASSSSSGRPPPPPVNPNAYLEAVCALEKKCFPARFAAYYSVESDCIAEERASLEKSTTQAQYDACATKVAANNDCVLRPRDFPECNFDPPGTLPDGADCSSSSACTSGRCLRTPGADCGKCTARLAEKAACSAPGQCQDGLFCSVYDTKKCEKRIGLNGNCTLGEQGCEDTLTCVGGKCKKQVGLGGSCSTSGAFSECTFGLSCVNNKCVENKFVTKAGQKCGLDTTIIECVRLDCPLAKGECVAYAKLGEPCALPNDFETPRCGPNLTCSEEGRCVSRTPTQACP